MRVSASSWSLAPASEHDEPPERRDEDPGHRSEGRTWGDVDHAAPQQPPQQQGDDPPAKWPVAGDHRSGGRRHRHRGRGGAVADPGRQVAHRIVELGVGAGAEDPVEPGLELVEPEPPLLEGVPDDRRRVLTVSVGAPEIAVGTHIRSLPRWTGPCTASGHGRDNPGARWGCAAPPTSQPQAAPVPGPASPGRGRRAGAPGRPVGGGAVVTGGPGGLDALHPVVRAWFAERFPDGPTEPQLAAWPAVRAGADVVVAAPTGSGKTLAAFLMVIDRAYRAYEAGVWRQGTQVVYVSPLKALAVDIHHNLQVPLAELAARAQAQGATAPPITVGVRTGDTPASARAAMVRRPPTILVTTPESLYLLLTAAGSRRTLTDVQLVIVDEAHATARDRRGAHLALSLERLAQLQGERRLQRIALSATQRPIDVVARLVTGTVGSEMGTVVIDQSGPRRLALDVELPSSELEAVASAEQMGDIVGRIAAHVAEHRSTLVFVNTRRMAERLARLLGDQVGSDQVAAHHGSLAADRRLAVEQRLRSGELRALVATGSLELGIDVGPVDLVCQVGSPRQIGTFLQRVGRANHRRDGVPTGVVFPTSRDDLIECVALVQAARAGRLDVVEPPVAPLDILAQQLVAEVAAAGECTEDSLYELVRRAAPYERLPRSVFDEVVGVIADGVPTGHGRPMAFVHRDRRRGLLRPRRGARMTAITCGGAIADAGEYRVVVEGDEAVVGTVTEDFAIESMVGDVFVLGTHSWRVRKVEPGVVRVADAEGAAPTIPFWTGEAPARSGELSVAVSELRTTVAAAANASEAVDAVVQAAAVTRDVAEQVVSYLRAGMVQLGTMPTVCDIVVERCFDEAGTMQLVVHAPFGGRTTRALGLALRKRLCATFDFELQAAANDDAVVLSLGAQHAFPIVDTWRLLRADRVREVLTQAVLTSPSFRLRWRHTCSRALAVRRQQGGRRTPLAIQRMRADDLMAAVFPALVACQENTSPGPLSVPDHLLVRQTIDDCLHELLDVDGLEALLAATEAGTVRVHAVETTTPSVLAQEILSGKPYTFLDDAPLEERRSRAAPVSRGLPARPVFLGRIEPAAIDEVVERRQRPPRSADELHDLLVEQVVVVPVQRWAGWFDELVSTGRALKLRLPDAGETASGPGPEAALRWCAADRRPWIDAAYPTAVVDPPVERSGAGRTAGKVGDGPPSSAGADQPTVDPDLAVDPDVAVAEIVEGQLRRRGPVTVDQLSRETGLGAARVQVGLAILQQRGHALVGRYDLRLGDDNQWCSRDVLAAVHACVRRRRRTAVQPVDAPGLVRFLLAWQHCAPGTRRAGRSGVRDLVAQLQGFELAAGAWETAVLPARMERYRTAWLDELCQAGQIAWGRVGIRPAGPGAEEGERRTGLTPTRTTPITVALRPDLPALLAAGRGAGAAAEPPHGAAAEVLELLRRQGALFRDDLVRETGRLPDDVDAGLWDLVSRGLVAADGFAAVRDLLDRRRSSTRRRGRRAGGELPASAGGRWSLLPPPADVAGHELAELVARQLLDRWGIVLWELVQRETLAVAWRDIVAALRRLEDRGEALTGRFVTGFSGQQFAHPLAPPELERARRSAGAQVVVEVAAADPLNLVGVVLPGPRPSATTRAAVVYRDGALVGVVGRRGGSGRLGPAVAATAPPARVTG